LKEGKLKPLSFRKNIFMLAVTIPLLLSMSGCIYLVVGGIGVLGGYVVSPDTVEGLTEHSVEEVWDAAVEIVSIMGVIIEEHEDGGVLHAEMNGAKVTITVVPISETTVKLTVKARRLHFPKISAAQDVFVKIMKHLGE